MSYKTLLVHIDDGQQAKARIDLALELANRWDAHLIGLYTTDQNTFRPVRAHDEWLKRAVDERLHEERKQIAEQQFLVAAGRAGRSVEWRAPAGVPAEVMVLHGRHADLLILGQPAPKDPSSHTPAHFVEDVVMECGRPVLVIPYAGQIQSFGENVFIAWDDSREAARAVMDALPILVQANFVHIETITRGTPASGSMEAGPDIATYLDRHGIVAALSATPLDASISAGGALLSRSCDLRADLLVMGAYGHTRLRERILGGVTRTMLESMTTPVLLSH